MNDETQSDAAGESSSGGRRRFTIWMIIAAVIIVADQVTKLMILQNVPLYSKIPVLSFLNITHQENPGAAFSFLADAGGWQRWFFTVLAAGVSVFIATWLWKIRDAGQLTLAIGLSLILGGAIGNLIDRVYLGHVIDFIQVMIAGWPFPSFNVADSAITVGAVLLIIDALFISGREDAPATDSGKP